MSHELHSIFKKAGLKATPARKLILEAFPSDCKPVNAEFIYGKLKGKDINQVTVYRTLASFEKADIVKKVDLQKDSAYYELAGHHHHHIVCSDCGRTEGFDLCGVDKISKEVLKKSPQFKTVNRHSLELFGLCKNCS